MTDDEINRRVAEIEGWSFAEDYGYSHEWRFGGHPQQEPPDYATEWAWCGPLVEKHRIALDWGVIFGPPGVGIQHKAIAKFIRRGRATGYVDADTPQRAICLAVIALNPSADDGQSGLD